MEAARRAASSAGLSSCARARRGAGMSCSGGCGWAASAQRHRAEVKSQTRGMDFVVRVARARLALRHRADRRVHDREEVRVIVNRTSWHCPGPGTCEPRAGRGARSGEVRGAVSRRRARIRSNGASARGRADLWTCRADRLSRACSTLSGRVPRSCMGTSAHRSRGSLNGRHESLSLKSAELPAGYNHAGLCLPASTNAMCAFPRMPGVRKSCESAR